jgi:hypothetical protein
MFGILIQFIALQIPNTSQVLSDYLSINIIQSHSKMKQDNRSNYRRRRVLRRGDKIDGVTSPGGTNVNILCHENTIFRFTLLTCTSRNYKLTTAFISDNCRSLGFLNQYGTLVSKLPNFSRGSSHVTFLSASHFTSDYLLSIKLK